MSERLVVDQPSVGFGYPYWFQCTGCDRRVDIEAGLFELQCTSQADYSVCASCGAAVDVTQQTPTIRDPDDRAAQNDSVNQLVWYHTSRYESWPDVAAYTADVTAEARRTAEHFTGYDVERRIATKLSLAVHLGTYEATIENILRRLEDQDHSDLFETRYWLHRVEIKLDQATDLHPEISDELYSMFGDVELAQLQELAGARAVRYVNRHEAIGSISLAIDPALVCGVSTIALPVAEAALPETAAAAAATARLVAVMQSDDDTGDDPWAAFVEGLHTEYLPGVNPQVREPFVGAVGGLYEDPVEFHRRFRIAAGLLIRSDAVIGQLAAAPWRRL